MFPRVFEFLSARKLLSKWSCNTHRRQQYSSESFNHGILLRLPKTVIVTLKTPVEGLQTA
jgi:hypothetical protein